MKNQDQKLTRKELWKIYRGQFFIRSALNFERQQCIGFTHALGPVIEKYCDTPEEKAQAMERHMELFLTNPMTAAIPIGVSAAMEERLATEGDIDPSSISAVKTALMGPLAALGDSLINGTARPILAGIACGLAMQGSLVGPLLFLIGMAVITLGLRYFGIFKGYEKGVSMVADLQKSGLIGKITELASVAAFIIIGGFTPAVVSLTTKLSYTAGDTVISLQGTLDGLLPGLLPVGLTLLMYFLLSKKKVSPILLMLILMVAGVAGVYLGVF